MTQKALVLAVCGLLHVSALQAQQANSSPASAKQASPAKAVEDLVIPWEGQMMAAARLMPADKYNFTPASLHIAGADFTGVRTFADEINHVTQSNYLTAGSLTGTDPTIDLKAIGNLKIKNEIVDALAASFVIVHQAINTITPTTENDLVDDSYVGPHQTKETEATWFVVHGYDHYGQIIEYLRMNGIKPPARVTSTEK